MGYVCGNHGAQTLIFWPDGPGPFHVVVYGHGIGGGIDGVNDWLSTIASLGLIVIAPFTTGGLCVLEFVDMLRALRSTHFFDLHPALGKADFSRTGIVGHSMGGFEATLAGSFPLLNIQAVVASHGASLTLTKTVPTMFTTGTADMVVSPLIPLAAFKLCPARPKIFVNLVGGDHMEPRNGGRMNLLTAKFLSCHINQRQDHCEVIYGHGPGTLCSLNSYMECFVVGPSNSSNDTFPNMIGNHTASAFDSLPVLV